jgi:hypothetical protein
LANPIIIELRVSELAKFGLSARLFWLKDWKWA